MKKILLLFVCILFAVSQLTAQLVRQPTFDKIIKRDIKTAIFGKDEVLQGLSTDLTGPKAKISGVLNNTERTPGIWSMKLEAGIDEDYISVFKKNNFSNNMDVQLRWDIIPRSNGYKYYTYSAWAFNEKIEYKQSKDQLYLDSLIALSYVIDQKVNKLKTNVPLKEVKKFHSKKYKEYICKYVGWSFPKDCRSDKCLGCKDYQKYYNNPEGFSSAKTELLTSYLSKYVSFEKMNKETLPKAEIIEDYQEQIFLDTTFQKLFLASENQTPKDYLKSRKSQFEKNKILIGKDTVNIGLVNKSNKDTIIIIIQNGETIQQDTFLVKMKKTDQLIEKYESLVNTLKDYDEKVQEYEIKAAEELWTQKRLHWFTLAANSNIRSFKHGDSLSVMGELVDTSTFQVILDVSCNFYWIGNNWTTFIQPTVGFGYMNNFGDLTKTDYSFSRIVYADSVTTYKEEKKGSMYKDSIQMGAAFKFALEGFVRFGQQGKVTGGIYAKQQWVFSPIFEKGNISHTEFGALFNLVKKKETSYLSLTPFVSIRNMIREERDDMDRIKTFSDKAVWGIKVNLPINIMRKKDR